VTKLNQLLAIEKGARQHHTAAVTDAYHSLQKGALLDGISRTYRPKDDEGDRLPPESKRVQLTVRDALAGVREPWGRLMDVNLEKDDTNTRARADVVVDGETLLQDVPATYLLFLEKQLTDLHTLVSKLPRLDPAETWHWDPNAGAYATESVETHRSVKVPRAHVLYEATREHPAQVRAYEETEVVGYWTQVKFSGAVPADEADAMLDRVRRLRDAVKQAREQANLAEVAPHRGTGATILDYVLG
jgi:hypothetical protein